MLVLYSQLLLFEGILEKIITLSEKDTKPHSLGQS